MCAVLFLPGTCAGILLPPPVSCLPLQCLIKALLKIKQNKTASRKTSKHFFFFLGIIKVLQSNLNGISFTHLVVKNNSGSKITGWLPTPLPCSRLLEACSGLSDNILWGSSHPWLFLQDTSLRPKTLSFRPQQDYFFFSQHLEVNNTVLCYILSMFTAVIS